MGLISTNLSSAVDARFQNPVEISLCL